MNEIVLLLLLFALALALPDEQFKCVDWFEKI